MPEQKSEPGSALGGYVRDFLSSIFSELASNAERMLRRLGELVIFRKILKQYAIFLVMMTAATITLLYGLGAFISSFFPGLKPGTVHILTGIALIVVAMAYRKSAGRKD
ncbi:hypothetical protein HYU17_00985 [Candidatus Woesearchaeota archaeon]|nr:hypothetical protein [Candidatus Woesearchaeota archaeon]